MRLARLGLPARVAVAALLVSAAMSAAGRAEAGVLDLAAAGSARSLGGAWGTAREVPGTAALNRGPYAEINSVSCATAGNCSAGGLYTDAAGHVQAFVVSQVADVWGTARQVPGIAGLNTGGDAILYGVSCATPGNCSAGGYYRDAAGQFRAFVVSQTGGTWGTARQVPGTAALNKGGNAVTGGVSCAAPGNCGASGEYTDAAGHLQAFVVSQAGGTWGTARQVPGTVGLDKGRNASIGPLSCATPGNCAAGGQYSSDTVGHRQAFVVSQVGGTWSGAEEVPGTAALNKGGNARIAALSCAAPGNCSAGGWYAPQAADASHSQAFVVSQAGGTWGTAEEVPGIGVLNTSRYAQISSVSCAAPGHCSAGGFYTDASGNQQVFVVSET